jgi:chitodextrinase
MSVFGTSPALAAGDRQAPTKPANLRVTSLTSHNVMLAWDPSTDNSGTFSYRVWVSYGFTHTVPQTQTTFSLGIVPNSTYSFYVYAVDGSGNRSQRSNTVTVTAPNDTTAPTPPVVSLVDVNPTEISLEWTASTDDGSIIWYQVFVNGSPNVDTRDQRFRCPRLTPETTTDRRQAGLHMERSAPATSSHGDNICCQRDGHRIPYPRNLYGWDVGDGAREINLFWIESFDNQTPQASIAYEIYMNGVLDHTTGGDRAILYATQGGENVFTVIAVDDAGNRSAPASITIVSQ